MPNREFTVLFFANTDWYLFNFRLPLARALRAAGANVVMVSPPGPFGERLAAEGFRWLALPMQRRSLNPVRELRLLAHLTKIYKKERPDIAHHFTIKCVVYGSLAAWLAGVKRRINAVAGMGYVFMNESLLARALRGPVKAMMKLALGGKSSMVILQNRDDYEAFVGAGLVLADQARLIRGSGVDTRRFSPASTKSRLPVFRVLFAARVLWDKGIGEYVEAARVLKAEDSSMEFLVAGLPDAGNPATVPPELVERWGSEGVVTLLGHVENVADCMREVDLVVLPSYREGAPRSLIEAASCGLPIIATDVPGCREVVEDGVTGVLIPSRDKDALVAAIRRLRENPAERTRMGIAGRAKVLREFDEKAVIERTLAVYEELLPEGYLVATPSALA